MLPTNEFLTFVQGFYLLTGEGNLHTVTVGKILLKIGQREQLYCMIGCKKRLGIRSSNLLKDELYLISVRLLRCHETLNWFKPGLLY